MNQPVNILVFGASYGALLATKLVMAGHRVTMVCLPDEAGLINREGQRVRMPVRWTDEQVTIDSRAQPGQLSAVTPAEVELANFDLVALAMQEPQYRAPEIKTLLASVAKAQLPCMSIMNMPPLPYLARIPTLDVASLTHCYTDPEVWKHFDPALVTLCSPDPQAFRPPDKPSNFLQVTLPTNFKAARFDAEDHTKLLRRLQSDIEALRFDAANPASELPVKLKVHDSVFVPLAKWSMLLTGNYRCVQADEMRPIRDAVHSNLDDSRAVYEWVGALCVELGAQPDDLVPFEKYAAAARGLEKPSSAARALAAGVPFIERVDLLVQSIAGQLGRQNQIVDDTVGRVETWLAKNRVT